MSIEKYKWKVWDTVAFPDGGSWELWVYNHMIGIVSNLTDETIVVKTTSPEKIERFKSMRDGALELVRSYEEGA